MNEDVKKYEEKLKGILGGVVMTLLGISWIYILAKDSKLNFDHISMDSAINLLWFAVAIIFIINGIITYNRSVKIYCQLKPEIDVRNIRRKFYLVFFICLIFLMYFFVVEINEPSKEESHSQIVMFICERNIRDVSDSLKIYSKTHNDLYPDKLKVLVPKYITYIPTCSDNEGHEKYPYKYKVTKDHKHFIVYCGRTGHSFCTDKGIR